MPLFLSIAVKKEAQSENRLRRISSTLFLSDLSTSDYEGHLTFHFVADSRIIVIAFGQTDQRVKAVGKISYRSVDTIHTDLSLKHRQNPLSASDALNNTGRQIFDDIAETVDHFFKCWKDFVSEASFADFFPYLLNGIHFWSIWWNER